MFDLNWQEFCEAVLSRRSAFKGIFVQEAVIPWNEPLYQRPQHIATALGRRGYLVIYRSDCLAGDDVEGFREVEKNVWLTNRREVDSIEGVVRSYYSTDPSIGGHTPEMLRGLSSTGVLVYEYIDHIDPQIAGDAWNVLRLLKLKEFALGGGVDYVITSSRKLESEALETLIRDRVVLVQNGVDTGHYRDPIHQVASLPGRLVGFRQRFSRIVGYFGALAPWLWYEVICDLVATRQDIGFVFLGPDYLGGSQKLPVADNLLYLGAVEYGILPAYARQFDVCFIPFAPGEIAQTTSPLKLFEYFALEKPVVVTSDMVECVAFAEVFHGGSASQFSDALDQALSVKDDVTLRATLARLADQNDWGERVRAMEVVFGKLGGSR